MSQPPSPDAVRDEYAALPPEAQQSVADFLAFVRRQRQTASARHRARRVSLRDDPAIGIWRDRPEMEDSAEYIRRLQLREFRA